MIRVLGRVPVTHPAKLILAQLTGHVIASTYALDTHQAQRAERDVAFETIVFLEDLAHVSLTRDTLVVVLPAFEADSLFADWTFYVLNF